MAVGPYGLGFVVPLGLAGALLIIGAPQAAASCALSEPQRGTVAQIIDGETLALADGTADRRQGAVAAAWLAGR